MLQLFRKSFGPRPIIWFTSAFVWFCAFNFIHNHYQKYFFYVAAFVVLIDIAYGYFLKFHERRDRQE
ncbi:hypothetical protein DPM33_21675 [Mesorhizobium hawassense]|uniref:Uncharacterized protein n=1 Tax=Mesorhizobium hawassense TaxID=1209954 RepID=A0A330HV86_9HYPH|nr:hypothetical protein DPM33_21675 [Mesorhizobium hawassense]